MSSLTVQDYRIGWICALKKEMAAAISMLDEEHAVVAGQDQRDHNSYVLGRIHQHNVVIACMPAGVDGLVPAATVTQMLLEKGAKVNAQGGSYSTALQAAAFFGYRDIVKTLLGKGADVNAQGGKYGTALRAAAALGRKEVVQILLSNGAEVNETGAEYGTALQTTWMFGHGQVAQTLLDAGADVDLLVATAPREAVLQAAADGSCPEVLNRLLAKGVIGYETVTFLGTDVL